MRKVKKINGFLVVRFNDREKKNYPTLGSFGVIDAEQYTGNIDIDRGVLEYDDAETLEVAAEQARGLTAEVDYPDKGPSYSVVVETDEGATVESEIMPQLLIAGWEEQLKAQIKSPNYKDVDPRTAAHELFGYKVALCDLGFIDRTALAVSPTHFAPGMMEQPLPRNSEELLAHICDKVCRYSNRAGSQGELDTMCAKCIVSRLENEASDRGLYIVDTAKRRLDGLIQELAETQLNTKAEHLEHEARAYLEALSTTKILSEREAAIYKAAISEALKGRPDPPMRETFVNLPAGLVRAGDIKKAYTLGLALAEKCPDNDCRVYLNIFNMAREIDATLDELSEKAAVALPLRRALMEHTGELWRMYCENHAIQQFKKGMQS